MQELSSIHQDLNILSFSQFVWDLLASKPKTCLPLLITEKVSVHLSLYQLWSVVNLEVMILLASSFKVQMSQVVELDPWSKWPYLRQVIHMFQNNQLTCSCSMLIQQVNQMGLEVKDKEMNRRKKKYPTTDLGLEVKDMVGDCKIVLQSVQREGRLIIMMTMRTEHMKCYHDDDEGVDNVLLCIMMNDWAPEYNARHNHDDNEIEISVEDVHLMI